MAIHPQLEGVATMTKTKVTIDELKAIYAERLGRSERHIVIQKHDLLGFRATVIAGLRDLKAVGASVDRLTAELRTKYELVDRETPAA
jgi:hypothetical protein